MLSAYRCYKGVIADTFIRVRTNAVLGAEGAIWYSDQIPSPSSSLFGRVLLHFCAQLTGGSYYSTSWYMYSVLKKVLEYEQKKVLQGRKKKYCKVAKKKYCSFSTRFSTRRTKFTYIQNTSIHTGRTVLQGPHGRPPPPCSGATPQWTTTGTQRRVCTR